MPMGDGTGPAGYGPSTGRGAGFCNGYDRPGSYNRGGGHGFGRGSGRGFGRGRASFGGGFGHGTGMRRGGYGRGFVRDFPPMGAQRITDEEYRGMLQDEVDYLEKRLAELREDLKDDTEAGEE